MSDITFAGEPRDPEEEAVEWGDVIPFRGEAMPEGSDPAAMDAEVLTFGEWLELYAPIAAFELETYNG